MQHLLVSPSLTNTYQFFTKFDSEQSVREKGLDKLIKLLVTDKYWVSQPTDKYLRVIWEGLFFSKSSIKRLILDVVFWHADKSQYQRETSLKIAGIMTNLPGPTSEEANARKKAWFEACLYILNKHWHKVDNFRIDKFLALLRHMFSQALTFIKSGEYAQIDLDWFEQLLQKTLTDPKSSQGIALHICDIFIPELGKIDSKDISLHNLSGLLKPFLTSLAKSSSQMVQ